MIKIFNTKNISIAIALLFVGIDSNGASTETEKNEFDRSKALEETLIKNYESLLEKHKEMHKEMNKMMIKRDGMPPSPYDIPYIIVKPAKTLLSLYVSKNVKDQKKSHILAYLIHQVDFSRTSKELFDGETPFRIGIITLPERPDIQQYEKVVSEGIQKTKDIFSKHPLGFLYRNLKELAFSEKEKLNNEILEVLETLKGFNEAYQEIQQALEEEKHFLEIQEKNMDATLENQGFFKVGNFLHPQKILSIGEKGTPIVVTSHFVNALINSGKFSLEEAKLLILGFLRDLPIPYNQEIVADIQKDWQKEDAILKKLRDFE